MSSLAQALETPTQPESVTTISATARVDYILRFSKQAVMVVDEQIALCSSVGSQFLSNLSPDHNAAYITMSAKLNNLQVRCRIIEQLFGNTLFDPEQSVAVSLINLVKKHQQPVSIVIDNAHLLSLQLTHELCQLAEIAKKSDHHISILMLSTPQGGLKICENQSLFHKKLAIISAQTGQLISHNAKQFKPPKNYLAITPMKKWLAFFVVLSLIAAGSVYVLFKRDVFGFSTTIAHLTGTENTTKSEAGQTKDTFVQVTDKVVISAPSQATASDIFSSLMEQPSVNAIIGEKIPQAAQPVDIINAIEAYHQNLDEKITNEAVLTRDENNEITQASIAPNKDVVTEVEKQPELMAEISVENIEASVKPLTNDQIGENQHLPITEPAKINGQYQGQEQGFVIQIAGFTQQNVLNEFLAEYQGLSFYQYQRLVNDETMTIVTSQYFQDRQQAELAITQLPQTIKDRSPWIKAITTINDEINRFQRSQSVENQVTIPAS